MAKRGDFELAGTRVAPGTRATIDLPVSTLSDHTPINMSVHVIHGKRAGPTMFVSAGIHGDEVIGVEIVRRLLRAPNLASLSGTLLVVPIVNAFGFHNRSRYLPDRRDLNRCFPGSAGGSLGSRMAHLFLQEVVARCEFGIDLHSAAIHRTNLPQIRISPDTPSILARARSFGAPVILTSPLRDGSLRGAARDLGVDVLLFEAGEGLRFDEMSVRAGVAGILRVMRAMGALPKKGIAPAKAASILCSSSKWVRSPAGGLLRAFKEDGEIVAEGDLLAAVCDPFGDEEIEITATQSGIVIGRAVMPVINEGDAVYHIAKVASPSKAEMAVEDLAAQLEADPLFDEDEII
jgi:predicted deacylase